MKRGKYLLALTAALCALCALILTAGAAGQEPVELETVEVSGTVDLFQCGSLTGNYTKPDEAVLFADKDAIEQQIYDQIYTGLAAQEESITIIRTDLAITQDNLDWLLKMVVESYEKVVNDNPRLFYVTEGYQASKSGNSFIGLKVVLTPKYLAKVTKDQISAFNRAVEEAKAQVAGITDDVEKLLILHDYLVLKNAYNWDVATTGKSDDLLVWSAYEALVQGDPVCQGYSLAYKLLLNELGIKCITVTSEPMHHMWNMVQIDGIWYHVDVTWDDPVPNVEGRCRHTYFLLSDDAIYKEPTVDEEGNVLDPGDHYGWEEGAPDCASTVYESGWVFNSSNSSVYLWNGQFYYVNGRYVLYQTDDLQDAGTEVTTLANWYHTGYGIAWANDYVYYVPYTDVEQRTLQACSLDSGEITEIGTFTFTAAADDDYIGLRYNAAAHEIEAVSSTRRSVLFTADGPIPAAAERTENGIAVKLRLTTEQSGSVICAVYDENGKQLGLACLSDLTGEEKTVKISCDAAKAATVKVFLLDADSAPLQAALSVPLKTEE